MTASTDTQQQVLIDAISEAVRDTLRFALVENSLLLTTTPVDVREMADGSGRWAAFGTFVAGEDFHEVHTRRIAGAFNEVEVLQPERITEWYREQARLQQSTPQGYVGDRLK